MEDAQGPQSDARITRVLEAIRVDGDGAIDDLIPLVYERLKGLARTHRSHHHTLQPTELVHEAWMKLVPRLDRFNDRKHFFAAAALSMRHILADYARAKKRQKRGGGIETVTIDENYLPISGKPVDLVVVHDCLEELERLNPRHAKVIELRVFGGLTIDETASLLDVSTSTVESDWRMARAWMCAQLSER